jgi:uncharacterized membrane protein
MFRKGLGYFFTGLAVLLPLGLTVYFVYAIVLKIDSFLTLKYSATALIIAIALITIIGMLASQFVGKPIFLRLEKTIIKTPIFGFFYKAFKDLTQAFVGKENKFSEPVMVKISQGDIYKIGFITSRQATQLLSESSEDKELYAVYLPISYSIAGDLYFVPAENIRPLTISSRDAMQYAVSGGVLERN